MADEVLAGLQLGRNSNRVDPIVSNETVRGGPRSVGELSTVVDLEPDSTEDDMSVASRA